MSTYIIDLKVFHSKNHLLLMWWMRCRHVCPLLFHSILFFYTLAYHFLSFSVSVHSMLFYPNPFHSIPLNLCFYILVCHFYPFIPFWSVTIFYFIPFFFNSLRYHLKMLVASHSKFYEPLNGFDLSLKKYSYKKTVCSSCLYLIHSLEVN